MRASASATEEDSPTWNSIMTTVPITAVRSAGPGSTGQAPDVGTVPRLRQPRSHRPEKVTRTQRLWALPPRTDHCSHAPSIAFRHTSPKKDVVNQCVEFQIAASVALFGVLPAVLLRTCGILYLAKLGLFSQLLQNQHTRELIRTRYFS